MVASLEMLSGRSKKEYAREAQAVAEAPEAGSEPTPISSARGGAAEEATEAVVAM